MSKRLIPTNIEELTNVAFKPAIEVGKKFAARLTVLKAKVTAKKVEIDRLLAQLDPALRKSSEVHYANELSTFEKELRKASDAERWEVLRDLQGAYESTSYMREHHGDPRKLATAHGLGEERRSRLEASLASMGPAALASLAKKAEVTGDKDLAAALIATIDTMPARERPVSAQSIAEKHFGDEAKKVRDLASGIDRELAAAMAANREFEGRKSPSHTKVAAGLKFGDGELIPTEKSAPVTGKRSSTQLISDGLAAL